MLKHERVRIYLPPKKQPEESKQKDAKNKTPQPTKDVKKATESVKEEPLSENDKIRVILEPHANKWMKLDELINVN